MHEGCEVQRGMTWGHGRSPNRAPAELRRKRGLPQKSWASAGATHECRDGGLLGAGRRCRDDAETRRRRRSMSRRASRGGGDLSPWLPTRLATPEWRQANLQQFVPNYTRASLQLAWSSPHFAHLPPKAPDPWPGHQLQEASKALEVRLLVFPPLRCPCCLEAFDLCCLLLDPWKPFRPVSLPSQTSQPGHQLRRPTRLTTVQPRCLEANWHSPRISVSDSCCRPALLIVPPPFPPPLCPVAQGPERQCACFCRRVCILAQRLACTLRGRAQLIGPWHIPTFLLVPGFLLDGPPVHFHATTDAIV